MKIAILTQPLWFNYGGILQNYALQTILKEMGHDVYTLNRQPDLRHKLTLRHFFGYIYRLYKHYILGQKHINTRWNPGVSLNTYMFISQKTLGFVKKYISLTRSVYSKDLGDLAEEYQFDAYIVGSDQVWLTSYFPDAFIKFDTRKCVKKIFYAASSGVESWLDNDIVRPKALHELSNFCAISVREIMLKEALNEYSDLKCEHVLDPTLLLDKSSYLKIAKCGTQLSNYIFSYILDDNQFKRDVINIASKVLRHHVVSGTPKVFYGDILSNSTHDAIFEPVEEWLYKFSNADYIITDSFHGTVFALIFNKQFIVIGNKERGLNRFLSLLSLFQLNDRVVTTLEDADKILYSSRIDFNNVNSKIQDLRHSSLSFLQTALK